MSASANIIRSTVGSTHSYKLECGTLSRTFFMAPFEQVAHLPQHRANRSVWRWKPQVQCILGNDATPYVFSPGTRRQTGNAGRSWHDPYSAKLRYTVDIVKAFSRSGGARV